MIRIKDTPVLFAGVIAGLGIGALGNKQDSVTIMLFGLLVIGATGLYCLVQAWRN